MDTPLRVKEFYPSYARVTAEPYPVEQKINDWFDRISADGEHEYDIRQMFAVRQGSQDGVLVFYEVTPRVTT